MELNLESIFDLIPTPETIVAGDKDAFAEDLLGLLKSAKAAGIRLYDITETALLSIRKELVEAGGVPVEETEETDAVAPGITLTGADNKEPAPADDDEEDLEPFGFSEHD